MGKIFIITCKNIKMSLREPIWLVLNAIQPMVWLLLYGQLFGGVTHIPDFPYNNYVQFLTPGIMIMVSMFGAGFGGMATLAEMDKKLTDKQIVISISQVKIILARMFTTTLSDMVLATVIILLSTLLGSQFQFNFINMIMVYLIIIFFSSFIGSFSHFLAFKVKKQEVLVVATNFFVMPLLFLSSAMMPKDFSPQWVQVVARYNPLNYGIESIRSLTSGHVIISQVLFTLGLYLVLTVVLVTLTSFSFKKLYE
jgi:ABC-2 type transport system permease protein